MYILFLDDYRDPHFFLKDIRTWVIVRNYNDFVKAIIEKGLPDEISFDHDLGHKSYTHTKNGVFDYNTINEKTGYDCAKFLIEYCIKNKLKLPRYQVHSMNPVGKKNIIVLLENFKKHQEKLLNN